MFLITGSGRSGTSAVAQLLHEAGLSVGHDLIAPDEHNTQGYFEERMLIMIDDAILKAAGVGEWFTTAKREQIRDAAAQYADYMRDLVKTATPAWKDPRLSWTLEPWLEMLPERPRIIVCLRSPAEVVASTLTYFAQGGDDAESAVKHVWRVQYERLLEIIAEYGLEAICVEYPALQADPERTAAPLARFVGRALDVRTVRRDLRHHAVAIPDDLLELYERVRGLGVAAV